MKREDLEQRTRKFAIEVIRCTNELSRTRSNDVIGRQLLRSACSVGANYREAARAESRNDFIHKLGICAKEAAETAYWLELLVETNEQTDRLQHLLRECDELLRIMISSAKTASRNRAPRT